jgi:hypothetical protein
MNELENWCEAAVLAGRDGTVRELASVKCVSGQQLNPSDMVAWFNSY